MVVRGADAEHRCMNCGHFHGSHLFPSGICMECIEHALLVVEMHDDVQTRLDRLGHAVQTLSERIDNAQLERLDAIASAWPKRERTIHDNAGRDHWYGEPELDTLDPDGGAAPD